ncbi:MAG: hypothetical protein H6867_02320 [Rhodospirillales bacterium]|nr:hypothetical protein [Rhodospirillales bacterium]MCB9997024.1 hypothetical protein [Rhodospirillales bacterium]
MGRFIYYAACVVNVLAVAGLVFALTQARSSEVFLLGACLIPPVLALFALYERPGPAERKLAQQVRLARLKKELEELAK